MIFRGAVIKEQEVTFAVVIVKSYILNTQPEANRIIAAFQPIFPNIPVILMAQDSKGVPAYYGRKDIANFLSKVPLGAIPWKEYSVDI